MAELSEAQEWVDEISTEEARALYMDLRTQLDLSWRTGHEIGIFRNAINLRIRNARSASKGGAEPFQQRVDPWMQTCFGPEISADQLERGDRLVEEVYEGLQAVHYPKERLAPLADYVWGRPIGEPHQEVGGIMVTLAAFCLAHGLDMHKAGEDELARIWTKVEKIRAKQAAKPTGSALPIAAPPSATTISDEQVVGEVDFDTLPLIQRIRYTLGNPVVRVEAHLHDVEELLNEAMDALEAARIRPSEPDGEVAEIIKGLMEDYATIRKWSGSALVANELSKRETRDGLSELYSDLCSLGNSVHYYADRLAALASPPSPATQSVGVTLLDREEQIAITEHLLMLADIDIDDATNPACADLCGHRICEQIGCIVSKYQRTHAIQSKGEPT